MADRIFWLGLPVADGGLRRILCLKGGHMWKIEPMRDEMKVKFDNGSTGTWTHEYLKRECGKCGRIEIGVSERDKNPFGPRFELSFGRPKSAVATALRKDGVA